MGIAALVLAGGRGSRLGADVPKPLVRLGGRALLDHVLDALPPEIQPVILNANESEGFRTYGLPVIPDRRPGFPGPLAGIEAAARSGLLQDAGAAHLLVVPGDTPFLTRAVIETLIASPGSLPQVARHEDALQPTVALWPVASLEGLSLFLDAPQKHSIRAYLEQTGFQPIDIGGADPFFNVNTPEDLVAARKRLPPG